MITNQQGTCQPRQFKYVQKTSGSVCAPDVTSASHSHSRLYYGVSGVGWGVEDATVRLDVIKVLKY